MRNKVIVIGGGASGLAAAIAAARAGAIVTLLEQMPKVGKKLLSTGNGKCNMTNLSIPEGAYRSDNKDFPKRVLGWFGVEETLDFFKGLGILPVSRNGYIYPASGQASAVLDVLRLELERLGVEIVCDCRVRRISIEKTDFSDASEKAEKKRSGKFIIDTGKGRFSGQKLILAAGSKAAAATGSDGSGYELAESLGHRIIKPLPALVQLRCREKDFKQLAGIRVDAEVSLYIDGTKTISERGELQLTDYGISGIPVFQISRYASKALDQRKRTEAAIDFLPDFSGEELSAFIKNRIISLGERKTEDFFVGIFNRKLIPVLLKSAGIDAAKPAKMVNDRQWQILCRRIKDLHTEIAAANPFENAQVCCGGADTAQLEEKSLESRLVSGLYLTGELLDVDGICGGYNLQWAWTTGILAGRHAGEEERKEV